MARAATIGVPATEMVAARPIAVARGDGGAVAAHVAVMPAVMALFFFVVQVSLWFYGRTVATSAAQHGLDAARVLADSPSAGESAGESTATQFLDQVGGLEAVSVIVHRKDDSVEVTIDAEPITVLPFFDAPITVSLEAPVERIVE